MTYRSKEGKEVAELSVLLSLLVLWNMLKNKKKKKGLRVDASKPSFLLLKKHAETARKRSGNVGSLRAFAGYCVGSSRVWAPRR